MRITKEEVAAIVDQFKTHNGDTGSPEVQIAILTKKITSFNQHAKENPKDYASGRGMLKMVNSRRSLLTYLRSKSVERYQKLITALNLRK